jgi:hypothetical protein
MESARPSGLDVTPLMIIRLTQERTACGREWAGGASPDTTDGGIRSQPDNHDTTYQPSSHPWTTRRPPPPTREVKELTALERREFDGHIC